MIDELTCAEAEELGLPERYAAGTLDDEALARFESHFVACERCQQSVELASAIRRAARPVRGHRAQRTPYLIGALLAVAAGLVAVIVPHQRRLDAIRTLGRLDSPPTYGGAVVRGPARAPDSLFQAAMADYSSGRYEQAIAGLRRLLDAGEPPVPADFFLGASLLETRRPAAAAAAFARVTAAGVSPYQTDAHFYRALALLQIVRPDSAVEELRAAARGSGGSAGRAAKLLRRLRERGVTE